MATITKTQASGEKLKLALILASGAAYTTSLFLPGILTRTQALHGIYILVNGWLGILQLQLAWYANPAYFLALLLLLLERPKAARIAATLAVVLGLTSFVAREWWFHEGFGTPITGFGSGLYVWLAALVLLALASFSRARTF